MKAVQYRTIGGGPKVVSIDDPDPGHGQVVLKILLPVFAIPTSAS